MLKCWLLNVGMRNVIIDVYEGLLVQKYCYFWADSGSGPFLTVTEVYFDYCRPLVLETFSYNKYTA